MPRFFARPAEPADSQSLTDLCDACTMGSSIRLTMRRPNYFHGAAVQAESPLVFVGQEKATGRIVASFAAGTRHVLVEGIPKPVRYLSDLRIHPDFRRGTFLARGFRHLKDHVFAPDEWAQTIVLEDNREAISTLSSGRANLPKYHPAGEYLCAMIPTNQKPNSPQNTNIEVRAASANDIGALQKFYDREAPRKTFAPAYQFSKLGSPYYRNLRIEDFVIAWHKGEIVGMSASWNQSDFKETRIEGYSRTLSWLRPLYNIAAKIAPSLIPLPPPGTSLKSAYAFATHCLDDDPDIFSALLSNLIPTARKTGAQFLIAGIDAQSPLCAAFNRFKHRPVHGAHYFVGFPPTTPPAVSGQYYFECARI